MRRNYPLLALAAALASATAAAQQSSAGSINGLVKDSADRPLSGVDVSARPSGRRARTDSAGRFSLVDLGADTYAIRARKFGYSQGGWDVKLSKGGHVDIAITLDALPPVLDTVRVLGARECPQTGYEAFVCRRGRAGGVFLDDADIDSLGRTYALEVFRDIPGFRVDFRVATDGPHYTVRTKNGRCIQWLVDGRPASAANPMPDLAGTVIAIEVYASADSVPAELRSRVFSSAGMRCTLVALWTNRSDGLTLWPPPSKPVKPPMRPPSDHEMLLRPRCPGGSAAIAPVSWPTYDSHAPYVDPNSCRGPTS